MKIFSILFVTIFLLGACSSTPEPEAQKVKAPIKTEFLGGGFGEFAGVGVEPGHLELSPEFEELAGGDGFVFFGDHEDVEFFAEEAHAAGAFLDGGFEVEEVVSLHECSQVTVILELGLILRGEFVDVVDDD